MEDRNSRNGCALIVGAGDRPGTGAAIAARAAREGLPPRQLPPFPAKHPPAT